MIPQLGFPKKMSISSYCAAPTRPTIMPDRDIAPVYVDNKQSENEDTVYQAKIMATYSDGQRQIQKLFKSYNNKRKTTYYSIHLVRGTHLVHHAVEDTHLIVGITGRYSFSAAQEYVVTGEFARGDKALSGLHRKCGFAIPLQVERGQARQYPWGHVLAYQRTHDVRYKFLDKNTNRRYLRKGLEKFQPLSCVHVLLPNQRER